MPCCVADSESLVKIVAIVTCLVVLVLLTLACIVGRHYCSPSACTMHRDTAHSTGHLACPQSQSSEVRLLLAFCTLKKKNTTNNSSNKKTFCGSCRQRRELEHRRQMNVLKNAGEGDLGGGVREDPRSSTFQGCDAVFIAICAVLTSPYRADRKPTNQELPATLRDEKTGSATCRLRQEVGEP
ncbi:hypothetical protein C0Q70_19525 [Pomacea canaliculata]|uniref:Uncharacterized protein n=1 Tax=Pomacea canaliculata TaxID=400727 RepID=A0A2T7NJK3_POMCA|nr:hypothetical protein C0Q70_19525 [Pomacea canaliculata]